MNAGSVIRALRSRHTVALCALLYIPFMLQTEAHAQSDGATTWRVTVGGFVGTMVFDEKLADYRWDVRPATQSGIQGLVYRNRISGGLRLWQSSTTQESGIPGETLVPHVKLIGAELVGQLRIVRYRSVELWGLANTGRIHMGYSPDQATFDPGGGLAPITVDFDPISEWTLGYGATIRSDLGQHLALAMQVEQATFALNTAHRRGGEIVQERERFRNWSLRMELSWLVSFR